MINLSKRRRIEGKTNYLKRMRLLEGKKPRIVVRKSNKYVTLQYVESKMAQDSVAVSVISKDLLDYGWPEAKAGSLKSLGAAYLAGFLFGKKLGSKKEYVIDTGLIRSTKGSKIYAALQGISDAGLKIAIGKQMQPDEKRIKSDNLKDFFDKVKDKIAASGGKKA